MMASLASDIRTPGIEMPVVLAALTSSVLSLVLPFVVMHVYDRVLPNQTLSTLYVMAAAVVVVIAIDAVLRLARARLLEWHGAAFEHRASCALVQQILDMSDEELSTTNSGSHLARHSAIGTIRTFLNRRIAIFEAPIGLIAIASVAMISLKLLVVPIIAISGLAIFSRHLSSRLYSLVRAGTENRSQRDSFIDEVLSRHHTLKGLALEGQMLRRYRRLCDTRALHDYETTRIMATIRSAGETCSHLVLIGVTIGGGVLVVQGEISIGQMAAATLLCSRSIQPIFSAISVWPQYQTSRVARGVLGWLPEVALPMTSKYEYRLNGRVELRNVSIHRPDDPSRILIHDLSLSLDRGELLAVSGPDGMGKSQLAQVMTARKQPSSGHVAIDGIPVSAKPPGFASHSFLIVSGHAVLFEGTVWQNLFSFQDAAIDEDDGVILDILGLNDNVARLPQGFDTPTSKGSLFHDDFMQRLCIARALIRKPSLVVFDRVETRLDHKGSERFADLLSYLEGRVSVVLIANRPSLISRAPRHLKLTMPGAHQMTGQDRRNASFNVESRSQGMREAIVGHRQ
jgi:ATP-binding cassette subfamily C protein LapB